MKIAWCTPLGAASAIAEYSVEVCEELARECIVDIWAADEPPWRTTSTSIVDFSDGEVADLAGYDVVIYNFGDHAGYHRAIYETAVAHPGVCLLHDRVYQSLFSATWLSRSGGHEVYAARMAEFYGEEGRQAAEDSLLGRRTPVWECEADWLRFPLDDEAITNAVGVIVHADDHAARVREKWFGPVGRVHLPNYADHWIDDPQGRADERQKRFTLLTVGYINPNKQIHRVIEAIASDEELRSSVRYIVLGPAEVDGAYYRRVARLIEERSVEAAVTLVPGYQPDEVVKKWLSVADAYVNLREPTLESASASLMRQLPRGKPVIVSDSGFYAELLDDAVLKVTPGDNLALAGALRRLVADPAQCRTLGARARELAREFTARRTATEVLSFCEVVAAWRPRLALVDRVAAEFVRLQMDGSSPVIPRVAADVATIIGP